MLLNRSSSVGAAAIVELQQAAALLTSGRVCRRSHGRPLAVAAAALLLVLLLSPCQQTAAGANSASPSPIEITSKLIRTNNINHANDFTKNIWGGVNKPTQQKPENQLTPVILLPGDGGSRLQAKLNRRDVLHHYCERNSKDWFDLYLSLSNLVPFALDCWLDK